MAAQQTRTSYLWSGFRSSRRYHDSEPGEAAEGNCAGRWVRMEKLVDVRTGRVVRYQGAKVGCWAVLEEGWGARNMAFSVLAIVRMGRERMDVRRESFGTRIVMKLAG